MRWSTSFLFELPATIRVIITKPAPLKPEVTVRGWIKSVRAHKNVSFAAISDGSTGDSLQAVFKGDIATEQ